MWLSEEKRLLRVKAGQLLLIILEFYSKLLLNKASKFLPFFKSSGIDFKKLEGKKIKFKQHKCNYTKKTQ